ncbi:MAG: methyltransferase domain-containing protein [Acidobacteriia bacterium]|nr:methyltransferase domain-containing protein [Terriglobia bacterium]
MERGPDLRQSVLRAYSAAALRPNDAHAFPVGRTFAESLGYPPEVLASLPAACTDAFAGVSNLSLSAEIPPGRVILDLGCGAGLDSLIMARRTGPHGTVIGVDFSFPMLARARHSARTAGIPNVAFCLAAAENLPLRSGSIAVAIANGIFNLNPNRTTIFRELARVLQEDGVVYSSELVLRGPLPLGHAGSEADWFA